jgi:hypothetical protein
MKAQKLLEGENYVTISLVHVVVKNMRKQLEELLADRLHQSEYIKNMVVTLYNSFQEKWGSGIEGTIWGEHLSEGHGRRHVGLRVLHMTSAYLDPRFKPEHGKTDKSFNNDDRQSIAQEVLRQGELVKREMDDEDTIKVAAERVVAKVGVTATSRRVEPNQSDELFDQDSDDDLATAALSAPRFVVISAGARRRAAVMTEMTTYERMPKLRRKILDPITGIETRTNPLNWWREHVYVLPILSRLARRTLCVPASSAPCERFFSHAGLTIRNNRASLLPDSAEDLIFLHDAWPVLLGDK